MRLFPRLLKIPTEIDLELSYETISLFSINHSVICNNLFVIKSLKLNFSKYKPDLTKKSN